MNPQPASPPATPGSRRQRRAAQMPEEKAASKTVQDLQHVTSPDYRVVYTDSAGLIGNFYGLSIIFGQIVPVLSSTPGDFNDLVVEDRVVVSMSMEHAVELVGVLQDAIEQYEDRRGPVRRKTKVQQPPAPEPGQGRAEGAK